VPREVWSAEDVTAAEDVSRWPRGVTARQCAAEGPG